MTTGQRAQCWAKGLLQYSFFSEFFFVFAAGFVESSERVELELARTGWTVCAYVQNNPTKNMHNKNTLRCEAHNWQQSIANFNNLKPAHAAYAQCAMTLSLRDDFKACARRNNLPIKA